MDDVKRYKKHGEILGRVLVSAKDGDYVKHADYTALRARLEAVEKERDALKQTDAHRLQTLNHMGVAVERMQEAEARAERAEAALATARREAEPYIIMIGPYRGVCVGGRWNNWLFHKHADGHWVSQQKLNSEPLSSALASEAET